MFAPIAPAIARLDPARWPTHEELTALAEGIVTSRGITIRFVAPRAQRDEGRPYYERHIAESGEVETRPENWHDLFNALAWVAFPKAKAVINAQHAAMLAEGGEEEARHRSSARDALTLFDEGGVVVASSSPALLRLIVDFEWKELFWHRREDGLRARERLFRDAQPRIASGRGGLAPRRAFHRPRAFRLAQGDGSDAGAGNPRLVCRFRSRVLLR